MSKPLDRPEYLTVYMLLKRSRTGLYVYPAVTPAGAGPSIGSGFFVSRNEAELNRTAELLKDGQDYAYYIYELELPNDF